MSAYRTLLVGQAGARKARSIMGIRLVAAGWRRRVTLRARAVYHLPNWVACGLIGVEDVE
jgi:hypothetical protein